MAGIPGYHPLPYFLKSLIRYITPPSTQVHCYCVTKVVANFLIHTQLCHLLFTSAEYSPSTMEWNVPFNCFGSNTNLGRLKQLQGYDSTIKCCLGISSVQLSGPSTDPWSSLFHSFQYVAPFKCARVSRGPYAAPIENGRSRTFLKAQSRFAVCHCNKTTAQPGYHHVL